MRIAIIAAIAGLGLAGTASAAQITKTYGHFMVGGDTISEIEEELGRKGPHLGSTGQRHPGATRLEFRTRVGYREEAGRCSIVDVDVRVEATVILPRWRPGRSAESSTAFVWGTLAADIRRHEEAHVDIARRHAREIDNALTTLGGFRDCATAEAQVARIQDYWLEQHDRAQQAFDRIEAINFETRLMRLLEVRANRAND